MNYAITSKTSHIVTFLLKTTKLAMPKVVITGLGFVTSIGNDQFTVSKNLKELNHGIEFYPDFNKDSTPVSLLGTVKEFDVSSTDQEDWTYPLEKKLKREIIRGFSPHVLYAYCAMLQAIEDANLKAEDISNLDTGMFTASAGSPSMLHYMVSRMDRLGVMRCPPTGVVSSVVATLSFNLVAAFKVLGSSCGFASACASSGHALGFAHDEIRLGRQKRMFVVAGEDGNREAILPFAGMRALSLSTDPDTASRPFDSNRDGFVGTGGSAVLVLEDEEVAISRGAKIYAEFSGWGQASDGYNVAISHPEGDGLVEAIQRATRNSNISPDKIDYINAHATSTQIGDNSEIKALKRVFTKTKPAISSTKALTGHGLSLASCMEAAFTALAIHEDFTPGSAHIDNLDPAAADLNIIKKSLPHGPQCALSNSSGFGGANVALLFEKYKA